MPLLVGHPYVSSGHAREDYFEENNTFEDASVPYRNRNEWMCCYNLLMKSSKN